MADSILLRPAFPRRVGDSPAPTVRRDAIPLGLEAIDVALGGGLARARLHEIVSETGDAASGAGFAAMCACRVGGPLAWLGTGKTIPTLHPRGLQEIGVDPANVLFVDTPDAAALLRAADEAVRCNALGCVVIELAGDARRVDLTVSRRLMLAAEVSGVTPLLLRIGVAPAPTAAQTRWSVCAAPSTPLPADAPGMPAFDLELLRQRGGPSGMRWRVEWNRDQASFRAPIPGDLAAVPDRRPLADDTAGHRRVA